MIDGVFCYACGRANFEEKDRIIEQVNKKKITENLIQYLDFLKFPFEDVAYHCISELYICLVLNGFPQPESDRFSPLLYVLFLRRGTQITNPTVRRKKKLRKAEARPVAKRGRLRTKKNKKILRM